jgi:hypothetical protein
MPFFIKRRLKSLLDKAARNDAFLLSPTGLKSEYHYLDVFVFFLYNILATFLQH